MPDTQSKCTHLSENNNLFIDFDFFIQNVFFFQFVGNKKIHKNTMSNHNDIMCEVEIDSSMVEVVDNDSFSDMGVVAYDHYEVRVGDDDQYEEVTCENDDSQGLLLQNIDDGSALFSLN